MRKVIFTYSEFCPDASERVIFLRNVFLLIRHSFMTILICSFLPLLSQLAWCHPWAHTQCKSSWKMLATTPNSVLCSKNFGLSLQLQCFSHIWHGAWSVFSKDVVYCPGNLVLMVPKLLYFLNILVSHGPNYILQRFRSSWNQNYCVSREFGPHGTKTTVF